MARSTRDQGLSDVWHQDRKKKVVLKMGDYVMENGKRCKVLWKNKMPPEPVLVPVSDLFYCVKKGGVHKGDFLKGTGEEEEQIMMEGTKEKGPWYNAFQFSDTQIEKCLAQGWIEFMDIKVE